MVVLSVEKTSTKEYIDLLETNIIKYTVIISNKGEESANMVRLEELLGEGQKILNNTIIINNGAMEVYLNNNYILIPVIEAQSNAIITFDAEVDVQNPPALAKNKAKVSCFDNYGNFSVVESNQCVVEVVNIDILMEKTVNVKTANVGDVIDFEVFIQNNSTMQLVDVLFFDPWPQELDIVNDCFLVNGMETYKNLTELEAGIYLNTINPNSSVVITFSATVLSKPADGVITNASYIDYKYIVPDPKLGSRYIDGRKDSNSVDIEII